MIRSHGIGFGSGEQYIAMMVKYKTAGTNFLESLYRNLRSPHPTVGQGQPMVPLAAALSLAPVHLILVMLTSNKIKNNTSKNQTSAFGTTRDQGCLTKVPMAGFLLRRITQATQASARALPAQANG